MRLKCPSNFFSVAVLAVALWAAAFVPVFAGPFEDISYMTEEYYPFNYLEKGEVRGISADLLRLVWKELGVAPQPIESMPWARAYDRIRYEPGTVLFSMARTQERETMFEWAGPIMVVRFVLIARKDRGIQLSSLSDLEGLRIGTLREDISDTLLAEYKSIACVEPVANMKQNIDKLVKGRVDMVAYEERSWQKIAARRGLDPDDFETVYVLQETPVYFAFHVGTAVPVVREFQLVIDKIKATPAYQMILDKYLE